MHEMSLALLFLSLSLSFSLPSNECNNNFHHHNFSTPGNDSLNGLNTQCMSANKRIKGIKERERERETLVSQSWEGRKGGAERRKRIISQNFLQSQFSKSSLCLHLSLSCLSLSLFANVNRLWRQSQNRREEKGLIMIMK